MAIAQKTHAMKNVFTILTGMVLALPAISQCPFDPTITQSSVIMCPYTSDTLWTQPADSYQWYRNNNAIAGATNRYFVVSCPGNCSDSISVEATLDSCTEMSPKVYIDVWGFLLPYVIQGGDPGMMDNYAVHHNCAEDTVILVMGLPYDTNIQWFDANGPIPGANNDTLIVTSTITYTVEGSPSICPNLVEPLGLNIYLHFAPPISPVISMQGSLLAANPSNAFYYQWYLNGSPVNGANDSVYQPVANGMYEVLVYNPYNCSYFSPPFQFTGVAEINAGIIREVFPNPADRVLHLEFSNATDPVNIIVTDPAGRLVMEQVAASGSCDLLLDGLDAGIYFVEIRDEKGMQVGAAKFIKQ
jgi:hypothetical protein